ncbi:hypothetical protein Tco_1328174 [Tanacetum coccineum]
MDDPNITMEEYIKLEEEKARRRAIVFNDALTSEVALSCEPTVSPLNDNQIDFRILFDESDDEDYMISYDKNSFSYKVIYVDDLKMNLENDNDKVNMSLFPSSEPMVGYFNDFDYFKYFEKEFPAIAYNDALTSNISPEPTVSPQHIGEFDETSLSECDYEGQNVIYFNDLFPFNVIYPDDLPDKDNDNDKINIEHSSGDLSIEPLPNEPSEDDVGGVFIFWNTMPPKEGDGAWHIRIEMIEPDGEKFDIIVQSIPTTRKLSENGKPSDIIDLEHFHDS